MYKSNGSNIVIYIILIIVVALLAIIAFSALFAFLFYTHTTEVISTGKTIIITTATPTNKR
jgi:flagellar basal body-associated protein FliL